MSVEISKIEISVGGKKVNMTLEEAKELHRELDNVFRREVVPQPYWYPYITSGHFQPSWVTITSSAGDITSSKPDEWVNV